MNTPLVSFIIPVYNAEDYLARCLDSVLRQTYVNVEIILVDDCSTDGSLAVCEAYQQKDSRIRLLRGSQNAGPAAARNRGIRAMRGTFVYFMDADDELDGEAIELMVGHYVQHGVDLVIGNVARVDFFGKASHDWNRPSQLFATRADIVALAAGWMRDFNGYRVFGSAWGKLYRTDILRREQLFFNETVKAWEDILFVMEYLRYTNSAYYNSRDLYYYYHNQANHGSAVTYKGFMDFRPTVYAARDIVASGAYGEASVQVLYRHAYSECAMRMLFNCAFRMKNWAALVRNVQTLLNDEELQYCIGGYLNEQPGVLRPVPSLIAKKRVLPLILRYKLRMLRLKQQRDTTVHVTAAREGVRKLANAATAVVMIGKYGFGFRVGTK